MIVKAETVEVRCYRERWAVYGTAEAAMRPDVYEGGRG